MSENFRIEAEIVHDLPDDVALLIGRVIVGYSKLEHKLNSVIGLILQLDKSEARLVLREARLNERLDIIVELFALKGLEPDFDFDGYNNTLEDVARRRHRIAHGIWLQHPETGELFLRLTRGNWPKGMLPRENRRRLRRDTFPQSIPYGTNELNEDLSVTEQALTTLDELGGILDRALEAFPERFREPLRPLNPLGGHKRITPDAPPKTSRG